MIVKNIIKNCYRKICTFIIKRKVEVYGKCLSVNRLSKMTKFTCIGNYCNFNGIKIQGLGKVVIGNYFHSGQKVWLITDNHRYEGDAIPYDDTYICKDIVIDDFCWVGSNVMILGGVHIGKGAIIQAGAVVVNDIPAYGIAGGNPAKVFKYRDKEHFDLLEKQKKFH